MDAWRNHRERREADGYIEVDFIDSEPEEVPGSDPLLEQESDSAVFDALPRFFQRNPRRRGETPSWLAVALWADDYLSSRPTVEALRVALPAALAALEVAA